MRQAKVPVGYDDAVARPGGRQGGMPGEAAAQAQGQLALRGRARAPHRLAAPPDHTTTPHLNDGTN